MFISNVTKDEVLKINRIIAGKDYNFLRMFCDTDETFDNANIFLEYRNPCYFLKTTDELTVCTVSNRQHEKSVIFNFKYSNIKNITLATIGGSKYYHHYVMIFQDTNDQYWKLEIN